MTQQLQVQQAVTYMTPQYQLQQPVADIKNQVTHTMHTNVQTSSFPSYTMYSQF